MVLILEIIREGVITIMFGSIVLYGVGTMRHGVMHHSGLLVIDSEEGLNKFIVNRVG